MIKRIFDVIFSLTGLILLLPAFVIIVFLIRIDSNGPAFYIQKRVGRYNQDFNLFKFRTMYPNSDQKGLLTIGSNDNRITRVGSFLRKFKIDEFPQLFNVFIGNMSLVGPRPEVRKYVAKYTKEQLNVLNVRPGITDLASIRYSDENALLANHSNPENFYSDTVLPDKLSLNLEYVENNNLLYDIRIILMTLAKIWQ